MDLKLKNKVAIVTGGGAGIGEATCKLLAEEGAIVIVTDMDEVNGKRVTSEISRMGGKAEFFKMDVSNVDEIEKVVKTVEKEYGTIDVLVNNAGIYAKGNVLEITEQDFEKLVAVNVKGVLFCTKYVAEVMKRNGRGTIVNVASEAGLVGIKGQVIYNLTKAAVISITKSCAVDLAPYGIRVNAVCPGTTMTPLVEKALKMEKSPEMVKKQLESSRPLNRLGDPSEIAAAIVFLASDVPGYATGAIFPIDGGYTAW
ncbi:SDR family NAD(P)-dependent oxidoreductase [Thermotoga neapolitana]|jgi:NAD(P)-dependent dehydrogenase (short-subunit alcohol dehydrogenase family)|uniref:Oxidoreductase, short chain dehydrogenase/reductase family n=2 Tax=Thermotoga TaxID=2335 RepID=B9KBZ5_THENN|nr:SDR family oxidoreductase [Thermotoga neapolitana]ACM22541.1 oxidoreductase, short chain dehydrogenase/reductase family [Thermotoga neapolitana DSM 4359]KFZ22187.1 oxidoreductase, short chain dehydrogenase/reductase family protein [Thermotoga neapolitana LA10]KUK22315.1 MAG: Oxidoreductase, short chain dehydrogenase/reductase family [Thermotoga petrophila]